MKSRVSEEEAANPEVEDDQPHRETLAQEKSLYEVFPLLHFGFLE